MSVADVVRGFHDLTILARNVAELRAFYAGLGFRQVVDRGDELAVFLVGRHELAIHRSATLPLSALVLAVIVDDLEPIREYATGHGVALDVPTLLRPGLIGLALLDPNGNKLEFLRSAP